MSRRIRILLYGFGTLLALATISAALLSSSWFQRLVERRLVTTLESLTGGRVEVGEFRFRPWVFQVTMHKFVIHGNELPSQPPLFTAQTFVLGVSPSHLIRRQIRLRYLVWDGAEIHLRVNPDGSTNLPGPIAQIKPEVALDEIMDLAVSHIMLSHSTFYWNDQKFPVDLTSQDLALLLRYGQGHRYTGTLASTSLTVRSGRWSPPSLTFASRFEIAQSALTFTSLTWQTRGATGEGSLSFRTVPNPDVYFGFRTSAEIPVLLTNLALPMFRSGNVHAEGQGFYRQGKLSIQGRAQVKELQCSTAHFRPTRVDASTDYVVESSQIRLSNFNVSTLGSTSSAKAEIAFSGHAPQGHISARIRNLDLAALLHTINPEPLVSSSLHPASVVDGAVDTTWAGKFENLKAGFDLQLRLPAKLPAGALAMSGHVRGTVLLDHNLVLNLDDAMLQTPQSSVRARGTLVDRTSATSPPSRLAIEWQTSNFEESRRLAEALSSAAEPIPLVFRSEAKFMGEITGALDQPKIQGSLEIGEFTYHGWTWGHLSANVTASSKLLEVSAGRLVRDKSSLDLDAWAKTTNWLLRPNSTIHVAAQVQRSPIEGLQAALGINYPVGGLISGRLELDGIASEITGRGSVRIESGEIAGETFDYLTTNLRIANSKWDAEAIQLTKGTGRVSGQASYDLPTHSVAAQLKGTDLSLADFQRLSFSAGAKAPRHLEGRGNFDLRGEGTRSDFQVHSNWTVEDVRLESQAIGSIQGRVDGQAQRLHVQAEISGSGGGLKFAGDVQPSGEWPGEISGNYSDLQFTPWLRLFFNSKLTAAVVASGSFQLTGPFRQPGALELRGQTQQLAINFPELHWKNDQPIDIHYASQTLTASRFHMRGPSTDLEVDGSLRFGRTTALQINAQGTADANFLSIMDPQLEASGHSELKLRMTGTPQQPILNGTLEVQDITLHYGDLPFYISGLKGTIKLEGERATVASIRGLSGGGTVTISGFVTISATPHLNLQAILDQVRVPFPSHFTSVLSGNLRLGGTSERAQLEGELSVRQMTVNDDTNLLAQIIESGSPLTQQTLSVSSPLAQRVRLGVRVISAPPVRIETRDLRLVADVDLRLQGTLADPVAVGTIHLLSGDTIFRGNRYKLVRGDISLTNPFRSQANLDLEAQTRVQSYDLMLDVSGPFDRLRFAYRSDPPLPTEDILSLLALGYSRQQEGLAPTGTHPFSSLGASALLSEALSSQVTGRIQRLFGVSRIKIDPNVGAPGYGSGARVTVEQQVTPDFTVTYITNTAESQYRIIQFEWAVSDKVSVIGVRDPNGIFGLEFRLRQRFR